MAKVVEGRSRVSYDEMRPSESSFWQYMTDTYIQRDYRERMRQQEASLCPRR